MHSHPWFLPPSFSHRSNPRPLWESLLHPCLEFYQHWTKSNLISFFHNLQGQTGSKLTEEFLLFNQFKPDIKTD